MPRALSLLMTRLFSVGSRTLCQRCMHWMCERPGTCSAMVRHLRGPIFWMALRSSASSVVDHRRRTVCSGALPSTSWSMRPPCRDERVRVRPQRSIWSVIVAGGDTHGRRQIPASVAT